MIGHSLGGAAAMPAIVRALRAERAVRVAPAADPAAAAHRSARTVGPGRGLCERMRAGVQSPSASPSTSSRRSA